MPGFMGSEVENTEDGRTKKRKGMPLPVAMALLVLFAAVPLVNFAFGLTRGVMIGGSRYSPELVHWRGQPIQFSIAFCMSGFLSAVFAYFLVIATLNIAKAERKARADKSPGEA
jgi:hypothetical protein